MRAGKLLGTKSGQRSTPNAPRQRTAGSFPLSPITRTNCVLDVRHGATRPGEDFCQECCSAIEKAPALLPVLDATGSSPQGQCMERNVPLVETVGFGSTQARTIVTTRRKALKTDLCRCGHERQQHPGNQCAGFVRYCSGSSGPCRCNKFLRSRRKRCPSQSRSANAATVTTTIA